MKIESNINELQPWMRSYIARLEPRNRKRLMREIGKKLATANRKRMVAQTDPDGKAWTPRKQQKDKELAKNNKKKLFLKLRMAKRLRTQFFNDTIKVGFIGNNARIARIHQFGLREQLSYGTAEFPQRELIGIPSKDKKLIEQTIINYVER